METREMPTVDAPASTVSRRIALRRLAASASSLTMLGTLSPAFGQEKGEGKGGPGKRASSSTSGEAELKQWQRCRGRLFLLTGEAHTDGESGKPVVELLKLIEVWAVELDDPDRPPLPRPQAISLLFRSAEETSIPSSCYQLEHPSVDAQKLLLSPTQDPRYPGASLFEAVLN